MGRFLFVCGLAHRVSACELLAQGAWSSGLQAEGAALQFYCWAEGTFHRGPHLWYDCSSGHSLLYVTFLCTCHTETFLMPPSVTRLQTCTGESTNQWRWRTSFFSSVLIFDVQMLSILFSASHASAYLTNKSLAELSTNNPRTKYQSPHKCWASNPQFIPNPRTNTKKITINNFKTSRNIRVVYSLQLM